MAFQLLTKVRVADRQPLGDLAHAEADLARHRLQSQPVPAGTRRRFPAAGSWGMGSFLPGAARSRVRGPGDHGRTGREANATECSLCGRTVKAWQPEHGPAVAGGRISEPESATRPGSATVLFARRRSSAGRQPQGWHADVAQLVEHHLAKVRVAGSNPVVRSETPNTVGNQPTVLGFHGGPPADDRCGRWPGNFRGGVAEWFRQGPAKPCTRVRFPSPPLRVTDRTAGVVPTELVRWPFLSMPAGSDIWLWRPGGPVTGRRWAGLQRFPGSGAWLPARWSWLLVAVGAAGCQPSGR